MQSLRNQSWQVLSHWSELTVKRRRRVDKHRTRKHVLLVIKEINGWYDRQELGREWLGLLEIRQLRVTSMSWDLRLRSWWAKDSHSRQRAHVSYGGCVWKSYCEVHQTKGHLYTQCWIGTVSWELITLYNKGSDLLILSIKVHLHSSKCQPQSMILHSTVFTTQVCQALIYIYIHSHYSIFHPERMLSSLPALVGSGETT